jgi:glutamate N-acetyltransferase/amino-acid N-acetyltransferase
MKQEKAVLPQGFSCYAKNCGLKPDGSDDLAIFYSDTPCSVAGVFTRNQVPGAPIIVGREIIKGGVLQAVVVNSKISNVGTGQQGIDNARRMGDAAALELGVSAETVIMSSTGIIAKQLPIELVEKGLKGMKNFLQPDPLVGAKGIMTTDTYPKAVSASVGGATLTIVAKGSGMVEPNMATMLVYIFTDAEFSAEELDGMLRQSVNNSFNMLSVDTDTSTSDTCLIMANGKAGRTDKAQFAETLDALCIEMTEMLARDGEGATKLIRAEISGAVNEKEAVIYARSMINSPLIKTMAFGADPNIGRILMALGKCFENTFELGSLKLALNGIDIYADANKLDYDEEALRKSISGDPVVFQIDLGLGEGGAIAYGCDLTHGYVDENAAYYSS